MKAKRSLVITASIIIIFIIAWIIYEPSQDANADILDDMAGLVKKGGTSIVCIAKKKDHEAL